MLILISIYIFIKCIIGGVVQPGKEKTPGRLYCKFPHFKKAFLKEEEEFFIQAHSDRARTMFLNQKSMSLG